MKDRTMAVNDDLDTVCINTIRTLCMNARHGDDMPELSGWKCGTRASVGARGTSPEGDIV
jgi:hypothetical protein